MYNYDIIMTN